MPFAHNVFFVLNDASPAKREKLVEECRTLLQGHDGMIALWAGTRALDCTRDVNDLQFDVGLHVFFRDKKSHDAYQVAPRHMEFVARNSSTWKSVRVFDSTIADG